MKPELIEKIKKECPDVVHTTSLDFDVLSANDDSYLKVAQFLKSDPDLDFDHCSDLSGVDYLDRMEVVCHLYSYRLGHKVRLKALIDDRETPKVSSLTSLWSTVGWHEREAWDLYGIDFTGHPDLRRILSDDDQPGHPYRKDVPLENDEDWLLEDDKPAADYGLSDGQVETND